VSAEDSKPEASAEPCEIGRLFDGLGPLVTSSGWLLVSSS